MAISTERLSTRAFGSKASTQRGPPFESSAALRAPTPSSDVAPSTSLGSAVAVNAGLGTRSRVNSGAQWPSPTRTADVCAERSERPLSPFLPGGFTGTAGIDQLRRRSGSFACRCSCRVQRAAGSGFGAGRTGEIFHGTLPPVPWRKFDLCSISTTAPGVEEFRWAVPEITYFQCLARDSPKRYSHQVRRISAVRKRFRATWDRGPAPPA